MDRIYELTVRGQLGEALTSDFADQHLRVVTKPVETVLVGPVVDQAALYGLVRRVEALGLELVELRRLCDGPGTDG
jgi:hypothetical protein